MYWIKVYMYKYKVEKKKFFFFFTCVIRYLNFFSGSSLSNFQPKPVGMYIDISMLTQAAPRGRSVLEWLCGKDILEESDMLVNTHSISLIDKTFEQAYLSTSLAVSFRPRKCHFIYFLLSTWQISTFVSKRVRSVSNLSSLLFSFFFSLKHYYTNSLYRRRAVL